MKTDLEVEALGAIPDRLAAEEDEMTEYDLATYNRPGLKEWQKAANKEESAVGNRAHPAITAKMQGIFHTPEDLHVKLNVGNVAEIIWLGTAIEAEVSRLGHPTRSRLVNRDAPCGH